MLSRIYINNHKCLVNFDLSLRSVELLMGLNGAGKSTVFDVLMAIRDFVTRDGHSEALFPNRNLTRWQTVREQSFELEVEGNGGHYRYTLSIEHAPELRENRVSAELLTYDGRPLYESAFGQVQLYRDNHSEGPAFQFDWKKSGLGALGARQDNQKLVWFRDWLARAHVLRIDPFSMCGATKGDDPDLKWDASNFASWYQHLMLDMPEAIHAIQIQLNEFWEGFSLRLRQSSRSVRELEATVVQGSENGLAEPYPYLFEELSDGQRTLVVLYSLLEYARHADSTVICIDEPVNFVALAEIQPWLVDAVNLAEDSSFQLLLASHHPEIINYLAPERASYLMREGGATRVREFHAEPGTALTPAELFARGWEDG